MNENDEVEFVELDDQPIEEKTEIERNNESETHRSFSVLEVYGENLGKKEYITNPAIGRDREIQETMLILLTPEKSALLVGKPGIGKTAIVEGIGYRMQKGEVPDALKKYELIKVNMSSLLGNVIIDGREEAKLQILVDELKDKKDIILFIDEVHLLVNRNASNMNVDFANMLKPGLDRGEIRMIGATTTEEYENYILRDRAFLRRFQRVDVPEPDQPTVVKILMGSYPKFEKRTGVAMSNYSDYQKQKIFEFIVSMTDEYKRVYEVGNRYPDIALAVVGNIFSNALFTNSKVVSIKNVYDALKSCKSVYDDVKVKDLVRFKEEFAQIIEEEKAQLD